MTEKQWVKNTVVPFVQKAMSNEDASLKVVAGHRLPYANEVLSYQGQEVVLAKAKHYQTDILIIEQPGEGQWIPRVVIEAKVKKISTHTVIAYSQKALSHKQVHPYLRYGMLLGNRSPDPLPGRLFRHGQYFDFMQSWEGFNADRVEQNTLLNILSAEVNASRKLERIIYDSRLKNRDHYTHLHRPLYLG